MMVISVNPVNSTYYPVGTAANAVNNTNAATAYEQVLALQAEEEFALTAESTTNSGDASLNTADLLDLSPAALNILNGVQNVAPNAALSATAGTTSTITLNTAVDATTLTPAQSSEVASIVAQYAGQPFTNATFTQIEGALTAEGINPETVSLQQLLQAYSYSYAPGLAFNGQLYTDTLASELDDA